MTIAQDGSGDYSNLLEALASIPIDNSEPIIIYIKNGIYIEKLYIEAPYVTLIGESVSQTIISYDDYALKPDPNGLTFGTFNSFTLFIGAHDFSAYNLTIKNTSGPGAQVGQALAAYVDADRVYFKNCHFIGHQDTLFTGPLPPHPLIPGSFRGPREHHHGLQGRQYYEDCFIQGDIDFIFGCASAYFYQCEIFSNTLSQEMKGYITAASTPADAQYGYVFNACKLTSNASRQTVYLGRPWRNHAHVAFLNCEMGEHIINEGWHDWDKPTTHHTSQFIEFNNFGPGGNKTCRVPWSKQLSDNEAADYSREKVLSAGDAWKPWL